MVKHVWCSCIHKTVTTTLTTCCSTYKNKMLCTINDCKVETFEPLCVMHGSQADCYLTGHRFELYSSVQCRQYFIPLKLMHNTRCVGKCMYQTMSLSTGTIQGSNNSCSSNSNSIGSSSSSQATRHDMHRRLLPANLSHIMCQVICCLTHRVSNNMACQSGLADLSYRLESLGPCKIRTRPIQEHQKPALYGVLVQLLYCDHSCKSPSESER